MQLVFKATASNGGGPEFVLSDATVDRMGDIIEPDGWVLDNFKKNPVALWDHGHDPEIGRRPIGTWENIRVEAGKLIARLKFAVKGTSPAIDELVSLVEQGILRAVSVGFHPIEAEPIDPKARFGGQRFTKTELVETSLVAIGANPAALPVAKSLKLSPKTLSRVFGEHAEARHAPLPAPGEHASSKSKSKANSMTLSQRIENAQTALVAKKDKLAELTGVEEIDDDAVGELTQQIEAEEKSLAVLKAAEAKIGINAAAPSAPAVVTRRPLGAPQKEVKGLDLLVRAIVARGCAEFGNKPLERVLDERYPGHEATALIVKADQTLGTTTGSHWADDIVRTVYGDFMQALTGVSIYPELRNRGIGLSFDGAGTVSIPSRTAGGAAGGFVAEGAPIRVGKITTASVTMTPKKMGVIIPFSRELSKRSTPAIEALVRQAILEDTAQVLDTAVLDNTAASTARPAGLLNGVSAAASGTAGGNYTAVIADFKALLAPFYAANAADNITVIMNPAQALGLSMMPGPGDGRFGWADSFMSNLNIVVSTYATANRLIAIRNSDFATALGDTPEFDVSEQATIHMEDTTPLEIVSGTGPTTADPVRSLWQTASIGVRMLMDVSWKMRRSGMVQWIDTTTW